MECFMYNARAIELRGRPKRSIEAFTVFRVERSAGGTLLGIRIGRDTLLHTDRRFAEVAAALVPVEFLIEQEPGEEELRLARKSVERQLWSWRCEDVGVSRELGAVLLAMIDAGTLERPIVESLLQELDEGSGWGNDRLYYLTLAKLKPRSTEDAGLRGDAATG
jgi:hypothetical protein